MTSWKRRIPFRVDIGGVIEILGSALYSRPDSAVRELIQNAHDAIARRRQDSLDYQGRIDIEQDPPATRSGSATTASASTPRRPRPT